MSPESPLLIANRSPHFLDKAREHFNKNQMPIVTASGTEAALRVYEEIHPSIVVLQEGIARDILSETADGYSIVTTSRENDPDNAIEFLNAGADRYLVKPSMREIEAMVRTLRRNEHLLGHANEKVVSSGDISVDLKGHVARHGEHFVDLRNSELRTLLYLMQRDGIVIRHSEFSNLYKKWNLDSSEISIRARINRLRELLTEPDEESHIQTYRGVGYKFRSRPTPSQEEYESA